MSLILRRNILLAGSGGVTPPTPPVETPILTLTGLFSCKSCGGMIQTSSPFKWSSSTKWYGTIIDLQGYNLTKIKITRGESTDFFRYAFLTSGTFTANAVPSFCSGTSIVTNNTDPILEVVPPADAKFMFVYINSNGVDVSPTIDLFGSLPTSEMKNLQASLFTANMTIGTNGSVISGTSNAPAICCSDYLPVSQYSYNKEMQFTANGYPQGVYYYALNVAEYTTNKVFIRRNTYTLVPYTQSLSPECGFVRVLAVCDDENEQGINITSVLFDNDDIQVKGTDIS